MAIMDLCRIPLTGNALITADLIVAAALVAGLALRKNKVMEALKRPIDINSFNFVWLLLLVFAAWVEYANFQKCVFFPTYDRDSLAQHVYGFRRSAAWYDNE